MKVSIVIRNLNGRDTLAKKLPNLFKFIENNSSVIKELIIVDDGSVDDSVHFLNNEYRNKIKLIRHTKTRGVSASINTGVRSTTGDYVMVLNENFLPTFKSIEKIISSFTDQNIFTISMCQNGTGPIKAKILNGFIQLSFSKEFKIISPTFYANINGFVFRKKLWQTLGGLDEKLFSPFSWEMVDLSYRASKRGYLNLLDPAAIIDGNLSSNETANYLEKDIIKIKSRNELLMIWKNIQSKSLINKHLSGLFRRLLSNPNYIATIFSSLLSINNVLKSRRKEIKETTVSDEAVFSQF